MFVCIAGKVVKMEEGVKTSDDVVILSGIYTEDEKLTDV